MTADLVRFFDGHQVTTISYRGREVWLATEIGLALGYARGAHISQGIGGEWSDEFEVGEDFVILEGRELKEFKELTRVISDLDITCAPHVMLLYESGVNLVTMLSRMPRGRALRRWLSTQVLPEIRATGGYRPLDDLALAERRVTLAENYMRVMTALGQFDDAARFRAADLVNNAILSQTPGRLLASGESMVTVAQIAEENDIDLKPGELSHAGKLVARAYRREHEGREPESTAQKIGGRTTRVKCYRRSEYGSQILDVVRGLEAARS